jgi:diguanylate cyclase (GGDEF)-like protein
MIYDVITLFKRASFKTKIIIHFSIIILFTTVIFISAINYFEEQIKITTQKNLTTIREIKKHQIEDYFDYIENQLSTISSLPFVLESANKLSTSFGTDEYKAQYNKYNKIFRKYFQYQDFENVFLIDIKTDNIVYIMRPNFNGNQHINDKIFEKSNFQQLYYSMIMDRGFFKVVDFDFFHSSKGEPAAFYATTIFDNNLNILAILMIQLSIEKIDNLMTGNKRWNKEGLGKSGESYLVAEDCTLRNNSRFFIEDTNNYFSQIKNNGTDKETIKNIKTYNTNILLQKIDKDLCKELFKNKNIGVAIRNDYRGIKVLSSFAPVDIEGVNWYIFSEIDASEAFKLIDYLKKLAIIILLILVFILAITTYLFTNAISKPLDDIIEAFKDLGKGNLTKKLYIDSSNEFSNLVLNYNLALSNLEKLTNSVEELSILSSTDYLTKIYNRHKFIEELKQNIQRVQRTKETLSLAMIDIDFFKKVNDTYGHNVGDEILKEFSSTIKNELRTTDIFARWGGEEFIILFINTNINQAKIVSEKIRMVIEKNQFIKNINITCSIGLSQYQNSKKETINSFIQKADDALYKAKQTGRNQVIH